MNTCSNTACFLAKNGNVTFPLVTLAGLADGINPCAIGMLVFLLGYLVIFLNRKDKIFPTVLVYISTVYFTYLLLGFFLYEATLYFNLSSYKTLFQKLLGGLFFVFAALSFKDAFFLNKRPSLRIPMPIQRRLKNLAKRTTYPTTCLFALLVTLFEAPCSLPVYAGTAQILSSSGLPNLIVLAYFLYYNLLFILPLILVAAIFVAGVDFLTIEDLTHRTQPKMKFILGLTLIGFSFYFFFL